VNAWRVRAGSAKGRLKLGNKYLFENVAPIPCGRRCAGGKPIVAKLENRVYYSGISNE